MNRATSAHANKGSIIPALVVPAVAVIMMGTHPFAPISYHGISQCGLVHAPEPICGDQTHS